MTSPRKLEANRNNSRKSTGPRSAEGKARSARNASTHGLTASPGEPTEAYRRALAEWTGDLKPSNIIERTLIARACRAAWNLRRCDRHEDASAAMLDRDAAESYDLAQQARVETMGRRLIAMLVVDPARSSEASESSRPDEDDPATLVADLRRTTAGVSWLPKRRAKSGGIMTATRASPCRSDADAASGVCR